MKSGNKNEPSLFHEGFLEFVIGVGVEGVVQEVDVAASLERPHVLLEGLPLVPVPYLRRQKLRLWVYCRYLLDLGLRHCCCCSENSVLSVLRKKEREKERTNLRVSGSGIGFCDSNFQNLIVILFHFVG